MRTLTFFSLLSLFTVSLAQTVTEPKFSNVTINSKGDIQWTLTYLEGDGFSIKVEKLVNGKWTKTDYGLTENTCCPPNPRTITTMTHTIRVKFHKGVNIYRLVMTFPDKGVSDEIRLDSHVSNDDSSLWIMDNKIILDEKVQFEILNSVGSTIRKGDDNEIDISSLQAGTYYLYTKSWTRQFTK